MDEFNEEAGVFELEKQDIEHAEKEGKKVKLRSECGEENDVAIHYSVFSDLCSNPTKIRDHLDSGVLAKLLTKYEAKLPIHPTPRAVITATGTLSSCSVLAP